MLLFVNWWGLSSQNNEQISDILFSFTHIGFKGAKSGRGGAGAILSLHLKKSSVLKIYEFGQILYVEDHV